MSRLTVASVTAKAVSERGDIDEFGITSEMAEYASR
jgi:hypothetical protein